MISDSIEKPMPERRQYFGDTRYSTTTVIVPSHWLVPTHGLRMDLCAYVKRRLHTTTTGGNISQYIVAICTRNPCARARARSRQNAPRRKERRARFYLSAIYLPTRALPKRSPDPAGDRFEKLLIVLFWKGVPRLPSPPLPFSLNSPSWQKRSFFYAIWLTRLWRHIGVSARASERASERAPFDRPGRISPEEVWIDGWRPTTKRKVKTESTLLWIGGGG